MWKPMIDPKAVKRLASGGAVMPMDATDTWNASVGVPDPTMYRSNTRNLRNVRDYIKEQGGEVSAGRRQLPNAEDMLSDFQAEQAEQAPQIQAVAAPRIGPPYGLNLDNSLGLADKMPLASGAVDYRMGGPVTGGPPGVDTVPAKLTNGEYVLPVPTTQAMGGKPALDQAVLATAGKPPVGYADGGRVSGWSVSRAKQIEDAVNGAMGYQTPAPAQVAPAAAPQMELSPGEQAMLEMNRAREAEQAAAQKPGWKRMLGFAQGGQVQGYQTGGSPIIVESGYRTRPALPPEPPPPTPKELWLAKEARVAAAQAQMQARQAALAAEAAARMTPVPIVEAVPRPSMISRLGSGIGQAASAGGKVLRVASGPVATTIGGVLTPTDTVSQAAEDAQLAAYAAGREAGPSISATMTPEQRGQALANGARPESAGSMYLNAVRNRLGEMGDTIANAPGFMGKLGAAAGYTASGVQDAFNKVGTAIGEGAAAALPAFEKGWRATGPELGLPSMPGAASTPDSVTKTLTPQEQEILALKPAVPPAPRTRDIPIARATPEANYPKQLLDSSGNWTKEAMDYANANIRARKAAGWNGELNNSMVTPELLARASVVGGAPHGVSDEDYAKMSPAQKSAAKVASVENSIAAVRGLRNANRENEGLPRVGEGLQGGLGGLNNLKLSDRIALVNLQRGLDKDQQDAVQDQIKNKFDLEALKGDRRKELRTAQKDYIEQAEPFAQQAATDFPWMQEGIVPFFQKASRVDPTDPSRAVSMLAGAYTAMAGDNETELFTLNGTSVSRAQAIAILNGEKPFNEWLGLKGPGSDWYEKARKMAAQKVQDYALAALGDRK